MLLIGLENGLPGAQEAHDYLYPIIGVNRFLYGVSDLAARSGWAVDIEGNSRSSNTRVKPRIQAPSDLRVHE